MCLIVDVLICFHAFCRLMKNGLKWMKNALKWHGKHVFDVGRSMEESAMKIRSNGKKIATIWSFVLPSKVTAVTIGESRP